MSQEMVEGDCGVTLLGRSGVRYREGSKTVFINGEMLTGEFDLVVYTNSIKVWEGSQEPVSEESKQRILTNMQAVFRKHGVVVDFEK